MAYADARHTQRNVSTAALVAVLEVGLGLAIVAGLSIQYTTRRDTPMKTTTVTLPPPADPKKDPPKPAPDTTRLVEKPPITRDPIIVGATPPTGFTGEETGTSGGGGVEIVAFPTPTPSPTPSFTPIKVKPRGNPGNWVTENDYPTSEIRLEHEGITRFRLSVDAAGKVNGCTVITSSGWPVLDAVTCEKLARRAKFEAAIDSTGARTAGTYLGSVNWRLPEE